MKLRRFVFTLCILLLIMLFANGVYVLSCIGAPNPPKQGPVRYGNDKAHFESSVSADEPVNLMILGLDEEGVRTDVVLLFNFSPMQSGLNILSVARDTRVLSHGRHMKINAMYSRGGEGAVAMELHEITGLPIHYYVTMNFKGFRKIVDTLGGVRFNVPFDMVYDDPDQSLHIRLGKGEQLLDGDKAEQLVRYRKGNKAGQGYTDGDIGRIRMQQEFLKELFRQKVRLQYLSKADDIYYIIRDSVSTNIGFEDIRHYLNSVKNLKPEAIHAFTLPGDTAMISHAWYFIHDEEKTRELIFAHFYR